MGATAQKPLAGQLERRRHRRYAVSGHLGAELIRTKTGTDLTYVLLDASKSGLGIIIPEKLASGEVLKLCFRDKKLGEVELEVCWSFTNDDTFSEESESMYRCGVRVLKETFDLEALLRSMPTVMLDDLS